MSLVIDFIDKTNFAGDIRPYTNNVSTREIIIRFNDLLKPI